MKSPRELNIKNFQDNYLLNCFFNLSINLSIFPLFLLKKDVNVDLCSWAIQIPTTRMSNILKLPSCFLISLQSIFVGLGSFENWIEVFTIIPDLPLSVELRILISPDGKEANLIEYISDTNLLIRFIYSVFWTESKFLL